MKKYYEMNREECIASINEILQKTDDLWIVWQIYRTVVNMTKEQEGGASNV